MEEMPKIPHTVRRGNTYYLRIRVPQDLIKAYKPKKEITKSLQTNDPKSARTLASQEHAKWMQKFEQKRLALNPPKSTNKDQLSAYTDAQLLLPVLGWLKNREEEDDIAFSTSQHDAFGEKFEQHLIDMEAEKTFYEDSLKGRVEIDYGATLAAKELDKQNISYNKKSKAFKRISSLFAEALIENAEKGILRYKREVVPKYINPRFKSLPTKTSSNLTVAQLIDFYKKKKSRNWGNTTKREYNSIFQMLISALGANTLVTDINRNKANKFADLILNLPKNLRQKYPENKYDFMTAYNLGTKNNHIKISDNSYNKYIKKFSSLMQFAEDEEVIKKSPAKGLTIKLKDDGSTKTLPFSTDQLNAIFQSKLYTDKKSKLYRRSYKFWIPLVALWTGMRLKECCQLETKDVVLDQNPPYISLNRDNDKTLKNKNSQRIIPIHKELLRIGFDNYVLDQQKNNSVKLFPDVVIYNGDPSHYFSKWFNQDFLEKTICKTSKHKFHSFRHGFKQGLTDNDAKYEKVLELAGWRSQNEMFNRYGFRTALIKLNENLQLLEYPNLDLSHLHIKKS